MNTQQVRSNEATVGVASVDMKLEVIVIPVSDVDRAKEFYAKLGWRLDADVAAGSAFRLVQFTPPGSDASVQFGVNLTAATPGSAQGLLLTVSDIETAHQQLVAQDVAASEVCHCAEGTACRSGHRRASERITTRASQLWLFRFIQRSRRQRMVVARGHQATARAYRR
jgi:catechol 2,3-dioxygenase-like lactoylglutathione lyase family enzyme